MDLSEIDIDVDTTKRGMSHLIKSVLEKTSTDDLEKLLDSFSLFYDNLLKRHKDEDTTNLARYYRLVLEFKPALAYVLKPGPEFDSICDMALLFFNPALDRVRRQLNEDAPSKKETGPMLPGNNKSVDLTYYCSVCDKEFEIPDQKKEELLESSEDVELPTHHEKLFEIRIKKVKEDPKTSENSKKSDVEILPAEVLMGHIGSVEYNPEYLQLLSVGIDIGSSTSHLIFSNLTLKREYSFFNMSNRYMLEHREVIYESDIIMTPLLDRYTIDIDSLVTFINKEYEKAGVDREMVDSGAVIVTGETAKKKNALEIVNHISSETGKFVSATAGPNFESILGAMGSGIIKQSEIAKKTILNVDIGGGTSNLAIVSNGQVLSTACINVGGRLLGIDENYKIWRIDEPVQMIMDDLALTYKVGDLISKDEAGKISKLLAESLFEVMLGPAKNKLSKSLMMTDNLDFSVHIDGYSFSGGIAELIYKPGEEFNDIGHILALEFKKLVEKKALSIIEAENKIRATVIGAGAFSLSISGSTCFVDKDINLPLTNIPILPVNVTRENFSIEKLVEEVNKSFNNFDMKEGEDLVGLYFQNPIYHAERLLAEFAMGIEKVMKNSITNRIPIILLFEMDLARMLGITIRRETSIQNNLICLDELFLESGDWIDIGAPLRSGDAYPVTVKSLVFNQIKK
ncbi:MAG: ethanolamine ammonia-lyase reactivating factor EutA [Candidatus Hodarchaeales archaeon]|jgi:ethanolamine utilization protein EutA